MNTFPRYIAARMHAALDAYGHHPDAPDHIAALCADYERATTHPADLPPLDKAGEIAALDAFRASLPPESYLAAWLDYAAPHIAADIRNDVFPTFRPDEARAAMLADLDTAAKARHAAQNAAADIISAAHARAHEITKSAKTAAAYTAGQLARDIAAAQSAARQFIRAAEECERTAPAPDATKNANS